ncbi:MAG TPA: hypothetical protein VHO01_02145 [Jatrophihabitans sp.]|nr:hypothetical protein [Jatrophihabitans sp.]
MFARPVVLCTASVCALALSACGGSSGRSAEPAGHSTSAAVAGSTATPAGGSSTPPAPTGAVSIPPYLCDATDAAQNAADAYMGALSAGDEKQAAACVLPGTVPASTTHSLLSAVKGTAVYLPRDGVDGPTVFGYQAEGKSIDVTVTRESDSRFWVTKVTVSHA